MGDSMTNGRLPRQRYRRAVALLLAVLATGCVGDWPVLFGGQATPTPDVMAEEQRLALEEARRAVNNDPVHFGGAYFEGPGTTLYILFVGDDAASRARIAALLPAEARVVWRQVTHSASELGRIHDEILGSPPSLELFNYVAIDVPNNRVLVATPVDNPELVSQLRARYGDAVAVTVEPIPEPL